MLLSPGCDPETSTSSWPHVTSGPKWCQRYQRLSSPTLGGVVNMPHATSRWHQDIAQPRLRCKQLLSQVHVRGAICGVLLSVLCSQNQQQSTDRGVPSHIIQEDQATQRSRQQSIAQQQCQGDNRIEPARGLPAASASELRRATRNRLFVCDSSARSVSYC